MKAGAPEAPPVAEVAPTLVRQVDPVAYLCLHITGCPPSASRDAAPFSAGSVLISRDELQVPAWNSDRGR